MWQRWGSRPSQPQIGYPTNFVVLDDHEDRYLETIDEVDSICSRQTSVRETRQRSASTLSNLPP